MVVDFVYLAPDDGPVRLPVLPPDQDLPVVGAGGQDGPEAGVGPRNLPHGTLVTSQIRNVGLKHINNMV